MLHLFPRQQSSLAGSFASLLRVPDTPRPVSLFPFKASPPPLLHSPWMSRVISSQDPIQPPSPKPRFPPGPPSPPLSGFCGVGVFLLSGFGSLPFPNRRGRREHFRAGSPSARILFSENPYGFPRARLFPFEFRLGAFPFLLLRRERTFFPFSGHRATAERTAESPFSDPAVNMYLRTFRVPCFLPVRFPPSGISPLFSRTIPSSRSGFF